MQQATTDYIIIGAGSSGCVLANRLSKNPNDNVILLEAGSTDYNPWIHVPVGYFKTMHNPKTDWCYKTDKDAGINNRQIDWPRGKIMGGSSSINGLLYVRGQREDYDEWANLGNKGWSYDEVLPYFIKSEDQQNGANQYHGALGYLKISNLRLRRLIANRFISGAEEIGIPWNDDYNGANQNGVSYFQQTAHNGFRCSTARGFIKPIKHRKNLSIITHAHVSKILFKDKQAIAVEFIKNNNKQILYATKEIILSAGAINSPQILQLSGVGSPELLKNHSIECIHPLKSVGENLQDHLQVRLVHKTNLRTLNDELNSWIKQFFAGIQYILTQTGPLTLAASQVAIFTHSSLGVQDKVASKRPDIQFHFQPLSADKPGDGVHPFSAFTSSVCQLRPFSKGRISIQSNNPLDYPSIQSNYLSDERDHSVIVNGIKVARKIIQSKALSSCITEEYVPGHQYQSDAELLEVARNYSQSIYHPVGTCRMGIDSKESVVNPRLQIHGLQRLRVVDASIMPSIISGNTNAPAIMIAEKGADMILADNFN